MFLDTPVCGRLLRADRGTEQVREVFASSVPLFGSSLMIAELLRIATAHDIGYSHAERLLRWVETLTVDDRVRARGAESSGLQVHAPGIEDGWWRE